MKTATQTCPAVSQGRGCVYIPPASPLSPPSSPQDADAINPKHTEESMMLIWLQRPQTRARGL